MKTAGFLVLDFGSQLTQLIARRLRELNYYSEIHPYTLSLERIQAMKPLGIILSGGPNSVYEAGAPQRDVEELRKIAPLLGICYGLQLMTRSLGGHVEKAQHREYGYNQVRWTEQGLSTWGVDFTSSQHDSKTQKVWMSHGDIVTQVPAGFSVVAHSEQNHPAVMIGDRAWGLQFHPEVAHTEHGLDLLRAYAEKLCQAKATWTSPKMLENLIAAAQEKVGPQDHVLCGLSGGVDSSVVASLLTKALGAERVHCVFVDNGLLRKNEFTTVLSQYKNIGLNVLGVPAQTLFLNALRDVAEPESKRKIIGRTFIEVFEKTIQEHPQIASVREKIKFLAQGTLYPDVIESLSFTGGPSHTIKSHHNVGGLPERMKLQLVEPVRELFKDEVRALGRELHLPEEMLMRHPFPGPGLAIRIMGAVDPISLRILQDADEIFIRQLRDKNLYHKIWQAFCVLLPVKTVGVQGDGRTYDQVLALRAVTSQDGMTADWYPFEFEFLREVSNEITNKVRGINRVVYDVTSKPPATIEWE